MADEHDGTWLMVERACHGIDIVREALSGFCTAMTRMPLTCNSAMTSRQLVASPRRRARSRPPAHRGHAACPSSIRVTSTRLHFARDAGDALS